MSKTIRFARITIHKSHIEMSKMKYKMKYLTWFKASLAQLYNGIILHSRHYNN